MAKSAKRGSARARPRRRVLRLPPWTRSGWAVGVAALILALLAMSLWLGRNLRHEKVQAPAYEEESSNDFTALVGEVELAIYQSLRQLGIHTSQVQFREVVHRAKRNREWDYAEIEIDLSQNQGLQQAKETLGRNLAAVSGKITWETRKEKGPDLVLLIAVDKVLTHRLTFYSRSKELLRELPPPSMPKLAIIIDDLGYDGKLARRFLAIEGNLSFSVLPQGTYSVSIARRIHQAGRELLLHLPMEPKGYPEVNPGLGALLVTMTDAELLKTLKDNLDTLPYVAGVNNHMGSRFCEYDQKMRLVLRELKNRGLFFLDSRTSRKSKAYSMAIQLGVPSAERDVFLDNIQSPRAIQGQMRRLIQLARLKGKAIGIGHPHEATLAVLRQAIPNLSVQGVELVPVSLLLHQ